VVQVIEYRSTSLYVRTFSDEYGKLIILWRFSIFILLLRCFISNNNSFSFELVFRSFQDRSAVLSQISEFYEPTLETNKAETRVSLETVNESGTNYDGIAPSELRPRLESNSDDSIRSSDSEPDIVTALDNVAEMDKDAIWNAIKSLTNDWESSATVRNKLHQILSLCTCGAHSHLQIFM
jgi:hypothetical protein